MTWDELKRIRADLGLTETEMAAFLGVRKSTLTSWGQRGHVPEYIAHSLEAHILLSRATRAKLIRQRAGERVRKSSK